MKAADSFVEAAKHEGFSDPIRVDIKRFCERFKDLGCYKFSDNVYRFILRTLKKFLPSEVDLHVIKATIGIVYILQ